MAGVFISYSRKDQALARQVRDGLSALGVMVVWDESMPSVDWQEYLERSIGELSAIVVLWTKASKTSDSVRDEARLGLTKNKLVNLRAGIDQPPFPFDRINGLPLDGWELGKPHGGWKRLVESMDARLARDGYCEAGAVTTALAHFLDEAKVRRAEIAQCTRQIARLNVEIERQQAATRRVQVELDQADEQISALKKITASKAVMTAAWAERDDISSRLDVEQGKEGTLVTAHEAGQEEREKLEAALADWMAATGERLPAPAAAAQIAQGVEAAKWAEAADADDADILPPAVEEPPPRVQPESTAPPPVEEAQIDVAGPPEPAPTSPPAAVDPPGSDHPPSSHAAEWVPPRRGSGGARAFGLVAVVIAVLTLWLLISFTSTIGTAPPTDETGTRPKETAAVADAPQGPILPLLWIEGEWVVNQAKNGCAKTLSIVRASETELQFTGTDAEPELVGFSTSNDGATISTSEWRYERSGDIIRVLDLQTGVQKSELSICAR